MSHLVYAENLETSSKWKGRINATTKPIEFKLGKVETNLEQKIQEIKKDQDIKHRETEQTQKAITAELKAALDNKHDEAKQAITALDEKVETILAILKKN